MTSRITQKWLSILALLFVPFITNAQVKSLSTFDHYVLPADTFDNGSDGSGGFRSGEAFFRNSFDTMYKVWSGFALSNMSDRKTEGYGNQYSTYAKGGPARAIGNFIVATGEPTVIWNGSGPVNGVFVCNSTYTALSMKNGDQFAKKFGGASGDEKDFLLLTAFGYSNGAVSDSTSIYLADYTFPNNTQDYILDYWTYFDLSGLGNVDSIRFGLSSSDNGQFGMNTPNFFCIEDLNADYQEGYDLNILDADNVSLSKGSYLNGNDENGGFQVEGYFLPNNYDTTYKSWSGWSISSVSDTTDHTFDNQYSAITSGGGHESENYLIAYGGAQIYHPLDTLFPPLVLKNHEQTGVWLTNSTYTYYDMKNGSNFSKKFGGTSGNDKDYLRVIINGYGPYGKSTGVDTFYLADYRSDNKSEDYIVDEWTYVPLKAFQFKTTVRTAFTLESSDTGQWGMNTPAYFCMDDAGIIVYSVNTPEKKAIAVYPNPASDYISIPLSNVNGWEIIDMSGCVVLDSKEGELNRVDISGLRSGVYSIRVNASSGFYNGKFVVR